MIFLTNPKRRRRRKAVKKRRRFSRKQLAAQRRFAAMARARATAARKRKRATGGGTMAKRRRRTVARRRGRTRRRSSPVTMLKRRRVYATNPRRRRGRRRYRRNPMGGRGIIGQVMDLGQGTVVALVGAGVGKTVGNLIPFGQGNPFMTFAKQAVVGIAIRTFGARFVGADNARIAAIGAMLGATKDLIVSVVPQAETFLGRAENVSLPMWPSRFVQPPGLSAYANGATEAEVIDDTGSGVSGYGALSAYSDY